MGVPRRIGDIQPFAELGRGAVTLVYKGYQRSLDRTVLVKLLRSEFSHEETVAERFQEEAHLIAKVQHPNVVTIYDYGKDNGRVYFVAEFVEGTDLSKLIGRHGPLPVELALYVLREAAKGLQAAHREQILHRDIKPANILISNDGQVKLTDFGMASLTQQGDNAREVRGTPGYWAPEQVVDGQTDETSDLFSLGVTFYEMVTGRPAYPGTDTNERINALLNHDPVASLQLSRSLPEDFIQLTNRLLNRAPEKRWDNVGKLVEAINAFRLRRGLTVAASEMQSYLEAPDEYRPLKTDAQLADQSSVETETTSKKADAENDEPEPEPGFKDKLEQLLVVPGLPVVLQVVLVVGAVLIGSYTGHHLLTTASGRDTNNNVGANSFGAVDVPSGPASRTGPPAQSYFLDSLSEKVAVGADLGNTSTPASAGLLVVSTPAAQVYVNGDSVGQTPLEKTFDLSPGQHSLVLKHPDFPVYKDSVTIQAGKVRSVEVALASLVGKLHLQVSPWAYVYLDGELRDTIPYQNGPLMVKPGKHTLSLENKKFGRIDTTLQVKAGEEYDLEFIFSNDPS